MADNTQDEFAVEDLDAKDVSAYSFAARVPRHEFDSESYNIIIDHGLIADEYFKTHIRRYFHCINAMRSAGWADKLRGGSALELGASSLFPYVLKDLFGLSRVDLTNFDPDFGRISEIKLPNDKLDRLWTSFNVNLEEEIIPAESESYDVVLCFEVLEHLEKDPMFMMSEINRVLKPGGKLFLTTPNCTSGRNVYKIMKGYAPQFFMKYTGGLYKHNFEYAPGQLAQLLESSGFEIARLWTADLFEPPITEAYEMIESCNGVKANRGDDMLVFATKLGPVSDKYPDEIYVKGVGTNVR